VQGICPQLETVARASEAQDVQLAVFRVAEVVPGAEDPELDLSPLHTPCTLREAGVRDRRAIPDEHHDRDLPGMYMVPAGALLLGVAHLFSLMRQEKGQRIARNE
jgi:hypothetical protein